MHGVFVVFGFISRSVLQHQKKKETVEFVNFFISLCFSVISQTKHGLQFTKNTIQPSLRRKMGRKHSGNSLSCWMVWFSLMVISNIIDLQLLN